ncbi:MAG: hypothetical protein JWM78_369 [Verrucomicrobiaceae bacterium]|nr:hypothetical protein [Verrucomicrobiaceae bacterium]
MNSPAEPPIAAAPLARLKTRIAALAAALDSVPWLLPLLSFGWGWASFLLMRRGEDFARMLALLAFIGWPWLLAEPYLRKYLQNKMPGNLTDLALNFIGQSVQQELLFFSLPLILGATQLHVGQILFAVIAIIAALISTIDPLYNRHVAGRPILSLAFHSYCSWLAALVVLPMVIHVPLERALPYALIFVVAWLLITMPRSLPLLPDFRRRIIWAGSCLLVPFLVWMLRDNIPAAGLSVREATITQTIHELTPGAPVQTVRASDLQQGVVAFVSIRAPMGVAQSVIFEWRHGATQERIAAEIHGARKSGWRTWSRKQNFPAGSTGQWTVDVLTPGGQLIKRLTFNVE